MTANAIEEAVRLAVLDPGSPDEEPGWRELGRVVARTYVRTGYKGGLEVVAAGALNAGAAFFIRNCQLSGSIRRWRVTRADGTTFEGPFSLESYAPRFVEDSDPPVVETFELSIAPAGEIDEKAGETIDLAAVAKRQEQAVAAIVAGSKDAVRKVCETLVRNRGPYADFPSAVAAVMTGSLQAILEVQVAANPDLGQEELEAVMKDASSALISHVLAEAAEEAGS